MMEHNIIPSPGARKARKRVGRGDAAGQGSYGGRGMKGQKSRSGYRIRPGFEGGQLPLIKGLPMKRGFNNKFKTEYSLVKIEDLAGFDAGERVTPEILYQRGLVSNLRNPVKVLGNGEIDKAVTVVANKFTGSARAKIEAAGGAVEEV
ncbi:MAG: 50S ribosomal protein L15 [Chloroflexi bacterium]|nr:50S ribosomal protein L15 [Chloroflexota bacterium]